MAKKWSPERRAAWSEVIKQRHAAGVYDKKKKGNRVQHKRDYQRDYRARKAAEKVNAKVQAQKRRDTTTQRLQRVVSPAVTSIDDVFNTLPTEVTVVLKFSLTMLNALSELMTRQNLTASQVLQSIIEEHLK